MSEIQIEAAVKEELVKKIQVYLADELNLEVGSFDAEFLLEFFSKQIACYYYNQGLADAHGAFEGKLEEFSDLVYTLEKEPG